MDKYIVNGVEFEYDTFDLVNMEIYRDEVKRVAELAELSKNVTVDNYVEIIREMCEGVLDAFDTIVGEALPNCCLAAASMRKPSPRRGTILPKLSHPTSRNPV